MKYTEVRLNSLCGAIASIGMATSTQNNRPRSLPASSAVRATRVRVPNRISAHEIEVANPTSNVTHADIKRPWRSLATRVEKPGENTITSDNTKAEAYH